MLAYLSLIASTADDLRLSRIINSPPRGIGERTVETVRQLAADNDCAMFEILSHADSYPELQRPAIRLRQFAGMINELRAFAENNSPDRLLDELLEQEYPAFIDDTGPYYRVQVGEYDNLNEAAQMERRLKRAGYQTVLVR